MDFHQEFQFGQNEQIPSNKGSCLLDSENRKVSILDSKDNVYGNKAAGIDINRNSIVSAPLGSEINEAEGLDHIENLSGFREQHENVIDFRNGTNDGDKDVIIDDLKKVDDIVDGENSVPVDRASMFTDIFGPPDDSYESAEKGRKDKPIVSVNKTSSPNGDQVPGSVNILLDVTKNGSVVDEKVDEYVRDEDKNFVSGDIVWVMMKTKLWWPGFINEPSSKAPKKFIHKNCFLVKLFSNPSSVWATKSELKEFTSCFNEMVKQDGSRSFLAAVERAVNEISSHVKKELTCSCVQKPCPPKVLELKSFALSRFEPDKFLSFIKHIAIDGVVSQRVQITVTRDCVSSFYRSLGHQQLQVHQLSPNRNSSRKRSRNETESGKNLKKELVLEKCVYGSSAADIAKIINSSSEEMFNDLCWAAVAGSVRKERRYSGSLKRFFSCFRRFAFSKKKQTKKPKEEGNCNKPEKPKADNAAELDSSSVEPKKKRQRKINLNPESVDEGQAGLEEPKPEKKSVQKKKQVVVSEASMASKIPDLNANVFVPPVGSFPVMGQLAMSSVGVFPITGQHAMSSVGCFPIIGHAMSSVGGFPVIGQHAMSSVGYIQIPGLPMPSVGAGVQTTGHPMSSVGGFPVPVHAMSSYGGVQIPAHAMSSVGAGVQTTGHAVSSVGGFPVLSHAMSSFGGVQIPGHATSSVGGGVQSTGHAMSPNEGFQINGHAMSSNEGNMTNMESAFINHGVGWLDSNGNSMSFLQLLNDVQGGKGFENNNYFVQNNIASTQPGTNQIHFASFSRPLEANHINITSQSQTNPIPPPELKKKRKRKPKEKRPILINSVTSPLPDLNGTTPESNSNQQQTNKPPQKPQQKPPPSRTLCPKNGYKPVTLPSPPGFGPPRASASSSPPDLVVFMKKKIEMMKSTMEKAGDSLSTEMREKLENEIRGFTEKYNAMLGSSSTQK